MRAICPWPFTSTVEATGRISCSPCAPRTSTPHTPLTDTTHKEIKTMRTTLAPVMLMVKMLSLRARVPPYQTLTGHHQEHTLTTTTTTTSRSSTHIAQEIETERWRETRRSVRRTRSRRMAPRPSEANLSTPPSLLVTGSRMPSTAWLETGTSGAPAAAGRPTTGVPPPRQRAAGGLSRHWEASGVVPCGARGRGSRAWPPCTTSVC
mmetsp:Transcript_41879/g.104549  ORF Transcript_41879/g.104549 Transcript_41879/m.104549 type:complete len:207 (+) Transcript_41879:817-1437(+)